MLQHLGEAENMEFYFGSRSFDPTAMRQGSVAWMVNAGLVRASDTSLLNMTLSAAVSELRSRIRCACDSAGCARLGRPAGWDVCR